MNSIASTDSSKTNLLGLSRQKLIAFFEQLGEKPFRAQQVMQWMHQFGVDDFDEMTNISKKLREKLKSVSYIQGPEVIYQNISSDGTRKWVMKMPGMVRCVSPLKSAAHLIAASAPPESRALIET